MKSIQDNIRALSKESEARTAENGNIQKMVSQGLSRKSSVIPAVALTSSPSPRSRNSEVKKSVEYKKGEIDWSKSTNIDLIGRSSEEEVVVPPDPEVFSFGNALSFDGVNDYVGFPDEPLFEGRTTLTMSLWAKIPASGDFQIGSRPSADDVFILSRTAANTNGLVIVNRASGSGAGSYQTYNSTKFNLYDQWAHLVVVYDAANSFPTRLKLYVNGVYTGYNYIAPQASTVMGDIDGSFEIGAVTALGAYTEGEINEIGIWHGVLTDEEIVSLYNEGNGDFATNYQPENLRRYYRFNGSGSDTTLIDEGLDEVDGTLNGFTSRPDYWVANE